MNSADYEAHESLRELRSEFNKNYKKFLELSLLECLTEDVISSNNSDLSKPKLIEKLREKYHKSIIISSHNNPSGCVVAINNEQLMDEFSVNDFRTPSLDLETKSNLVEIIREAIENRLNKLNNFMTTPSENFEKDDYAATIRKFNNLLEQLQSFKQSSEQSSDDIKIKYEFCLNVAFEVARLLNLILKKFRLEFYTAENKERCEQKILQFKVLLGKILSSKSSILSDVYTEDKLKALRVISDQVDIKWSMTQEKYNRMTSLLGAYKSLDTELEPLLGTYKQIKADLEKKKFTLNTLKLTSV